MLTEWIVKQKLSHVFNDEAQRILRREQPKNRWWNCIQPDIHK